MSSLYAQAVARMYALWQRVEQLSTTTPLHTASTSFAQALQVARRSITMTLPGGIGELIERIAQEEGVDAALVRAVVQVESGGNPNAVSPKGAMGLMQLMPRTAEAMGVRDPFDPEQNLRGGVRLLRGLLNEFGDVRLALAAYNAGGPAVRRYGGIPPYAETQKFVQRVMALWQSEGR
ncbi:MAG: lytic transglycosylase domain-containing protein [Armatimonadota bacterium]|nr:lytic transglycosylase domain-containing protein [Armatimonadota bacterium]MDW8289731.1 lytic transglycosylase domain-containing protein [Armatimonadota bacterium]